MILTFEAPYWMKYWIRIPQVMAHCCSDTTRPRISLGAISDWYTGTTLDAIPMDMPGTSQPRFGQFGDRRARKAFPDQ